MEHHRRAGEERQTMPFDDVWQLGMPVRYGSQVWQSAQQSAYGEATGTRAGCPPRLHINADVMLVEVRTVRAQREMASMVRTCMLCLSCDSPGDVPRHSDALRGVAFYME